MGSKSVTGSSGAGNGGKTLTELAILSNGPRILYSGVASSDDEVPPSSPPSNPVGTVVFPIPLTGLGDDYIVVLTTLNGGFAYIIDMDDQDLDGDNEDDHFTGFSFITESPCDTFYIVVKKGIAPLLS